MNQGIIILTICSIFFSESLYAQEALSLKDYRQKVLTYNQTVQMAAQTVAAAQAAAKEVKTGYYPSLQGGGSVNYNINPPTFTLSNGSTLSLSHETWSLGAQIQQNIYTGGLLSASYNAAQIQYDIARYAQDLSMDNIFYTAELTYWNAAAASALLAASKSYLLVVESLYNTVNDRFKEGLISRTDLLKTTTSLKDAEYQVSKTEQSFLNGRIMLNILLGLPADTALVLKDSIQSIIPNPLIRPIEEVLMFRPDYQISKREVDLQQQLKKLDQSAFLPKAFVGASANYGTPAVNFGGEPHFFPIIFAQLNIPIFYWGKSRQTADRHNALIRSKELSQSYAADVISKELSIAFTNIHETSLQIDIAAKSLAAATESLELHTYSYQEGRSSLLEVQAAQLAWLQASINLIMSHLNHKMALAEYAKVVSE